MVGRLAALAALVVAVVAVGVLLLGGGSGYEVKAVFNNASQIVTGDQVQVAGNSVGQVTNIQLTPSGQAERMNRRGAGLAAAGPAAEASTRFRPDSFAR